MSDSVFILQYNNKCIGCYNNYDKAVLYINSWFQHDLILCNSIKILEFKIDSCYCNCIYSFVEKNNIKHIVEEDSIKHIVEDSIKHIVEDSIKHIVEEDSIKHIVEKANITNIKDIDDINDIIKEDSIKPIVEKDSIKPIVEKDNITNIKDIDHINDIINKRLELIYKCKIIKDKSEKIKEKKNIYEVDVVLYQNFLYIIKDNSEFIIPELFKSKFKVFNKLTKDNNLNFDSFYMEYYNEYYIDYNI